MYLVPFLGGPPKQITFCGDEQLQVLDFDREDPRKLYVLRQQTAGVHPATLAVSTLDITDGSLTPTGYGEASTYQQGENGMRVIGRHTLDPHLAEWKHYKGGSVGQLWVSSGERTEKRFCEGLQDYNVGSPQFCQVTQRIYHC